MCVYCELCVVRERSLRRADLSSRGVLMQSRNLKNEETMARFGPQRNRGRGGGNGKILQHNHVLCSFQLFVRSHEPM